MFLAISAQESSHFGSRFCSNLSLLARERQGFVRVHWHQDDVTWDATGSGCCKTTSRRRCGAPFCPTSSVPQVGEAQQVRRFENPTQPFQGRPTEVSGTASAQEAAGACQSGVPSLERGEDAQTPRTSVSRSGHGSSRESGRGRRHVPRHDGSSEEGRIKSPGAASFRTHPVDKVVCREEAEAGGQSQRDRCASQRGAGRDGRRSRTTGSSSHRTGKSVGRTSTGRRPYFPLFKVDPQHAVPDVAEFKRMQDTIVRLQRELASTTHRVPAGCIPCETDVIKIRSEGNQCWRSFESRAVAQFAG